MPLSFNDVYDLYRQTGTSEPLPQFAKRANRLTGTTEFSAGDRGGFGGLVSKANYFVDQAIPDSWKAGSAEFGGDVFDFFGGNRDVGESVGRELPRQAVNFLPWVLSGFFSGGVVPAIGLGATSALSGAQAYGDTGSPWRAAASAAMPYIGGKVGELAGRGTINALGSLAQRAPWLRNLGLEGGREIVDEAAGQAVKVAATLPDRIAMYLGGQVSGQAAMEGIQYGQEAIAQRDLTPTMYEGMTLKDYVLQAGLGNLPFAAVDVPSLARASVISSRPVEQPQAAAVELPKASPRDIIEAKYTTERAMAELLPDETERQAALAKVHDQFLVDSYAEDVRNGRIIEPPKFDWDAPGVAPVAGTDVVKPNWMILKERKAAEEAAKAVPVDPAAILDGKEQAEIAQLQRAEAVVPKAEEIKTPQQAVEALGNAHVVAPIELEKVRQNVENLVELGDGPDEAMQKSVAAVANEAKPKRVRTKKEDFTASEAEVQILEWGKLREEDAKTKPEIREQLATFDKILKEYSGKARASDRDRMSTKMLNAWRNWTLKGESDKGNLEATLRTVIGRAGDDALIGQALRGAGGKPQRYASREDAERRANYLSNNLDEDSPIQAYTARKNSDNGQYEIKPRYKSAEAKAEAYAAKNAIAQKVVDQMVQETKPADVDERLGAAASEDAFLDWVGRTDEENLIELVTGVNNRLLKRDKEAFKDVQQTLFASTRTKNSEELMAMLKEGMAKNPDAVRLALRDLITSKLEESSVADKAPKGELRDVAEDQELAEAESFINEALTADEIVDPEAFGQARNTVSTLVGAGGGRFRVVSAGGGFKFKLGDLLKTNDKGQRIFGGRLTIGKDGLVPTQSFEAVAKRNVASDEIALWKEIAPGAFGPKGVDVEFLAKELEKVPAIKVRELPVQGQANSKITEVARIEHELDTRFPGWNDRDLAVLDGAADTRTPEEVELVTRRSELDNEAGTDYLGEESATGRYTTVNPWPLDVLQGKREIAPGHRVVWSGDLTLNTPVEEVARGWQGSDRVYSKHPKFESSHYPSEAGANQLAFVRGAMHEFQPGAKLPDGSTAEKVTKVMEVWEVQSDWASSNKREAEARESYGEQPEWQKAQTKDTSTPLLPYWESLAYKAALNKALAEGADAVYLTDAESAMMTEGHDKYAEPLISKTVRNLNTSEFAKVGDWVVAQAGLPSRWTFDNEQSARNEANNLQAGTVRKLTEADFLPQVSQSGDMRAAYDERGPNILKKLTGDKGRSGELGEHQNAVDDTEYREGWPKPPKGSPVFKDLKGQPKTQNTGKLFDLTKLRQEREASGVGQFNLMGGVGKKPEPQDHIAFHHDPTGSSAEASLIDGASFGLPGQVYYFNRMSSQTEGQGGGTLVLKQLLDYADSTGVPIINEPAASGELSQAQLENWYKAKGFTQVKAGEKQMVYWPGTQQMLARSPEAVPTVKNLYGRILRKSGWTDEQIAATTPFVDAMERLLPFKDVQVGEVINDVFIKGRPIYGLATASGPSKKLYLSRFGDGSGDRQQQVKDSLFVLAHEASGHLLDQHYKAGLLPAKEAQTISELKTFLGKVDAQGNVAPEVKEFFDLWNKEVLPKELQDGPFIQELLSSKDPEEMFANLVAGWAHSKLTPERTRAVALLGPREARGFFRTLVDYARRLWGAMKGVLFAKGQSTTFMGKSIKDVVKELDSVSKAIQRAERDVQDLGKLYDSNERLWLDPLRTSQLEVVDDNTMLPATGYLGPGDMKDSALRQASRWFEQLHNLGQRIPAAKEAAAATLDHGPMMHRNHVQSLASIHGSVSPITGELQTRGSQAEREHKMIQLASNQKLNQLFSDIMMWNQGKEQITTEVTIDKLKAGNPAFYQRVMQQPEAQRTALLNQIAAHHQSNRVMQDQFISAQTRKTDFDLAAYLSSKLTGKFDPADPAQLKQAEEAHRQALKYAQMLVEARRLATGTDPAARMAGEQQLASLVPVLGGETFAKAVQFATVRDQMVDQYQTFFSNRRGFMSRMRFGDVLAKAKVGGKDVDVVGLPDSGDRAAWEASMRAKYGPGVKFEYEPIQHGKARIALPDEFLQIVRDAEAKQAEFVRGLGLPADVQEQMLGLVDIESDLILQQKLGESPVVPGSRKLAPGNLDMVATHAGYQGFMARRNADTVMSARLAYAMSSPELNRLPAQKEQIRQAVQQYRTPDSELGRALSLGNAVYYLGANIPAHLTNSLQSYMTAIPELVARGYSMGEATRRIASAHKDIAKFTWNLVTSKLGFGEETKALTKWKDADERGMLKWAIENGYIGFGQFDDIRNQRTEAAIDLAMARKKGGFGKVADVVTAPVRKFADLSLQAYAATERLNVMTALVAGYRAAKAKQGKNFDRAAAREQAVEFMRSVTYQGGRANRPVAPYEGQHKLIGHLAYGLQTYTLGWLGQLARYVQHWRGPEYANLTEGQRKASRNAALTMLGTQFAAAGALGMPFFGAALTLLEKALGKDIKGNLYTQLSELLDSDEETGGGLADAVMTGGANAALANLGLPLDLGGRFAIGGTPGFNEYEGFSENAVFGPTAGIVGSVLAGLKGAYEGDWGKTAKEFAPNAMKRGIDYWLNGGQIVSSQGVPFDATEGERIGYQLGFFPSRLKKLRQYQTYSQNAKREQAQKYAKDIDELAEFVLSDDPQAAMEAFNAKLAELDGTKTRRELASDIATRAATKTFPTDVRADARGEQGEYLMQIAQALGVPLPQANQMQQLDFKQRIMAMFGAQPRPSRSQRSRAAAADLLGQEYSPFPDQSYGRGQALF
jgi:hypothetical protein